MTDTDNKHYQTSYGRHSSRPDYTRCCVQVSTGPWDYAQCTRGRGHGPDEAYCKQHDPVAVSARREASNRKFHDKANAMQVQWHGPRFLKALRLIAEGHNDPRAVAREAVDAYERSLR